MNNNDQHDNASFADLLAKEFSAPERLEPGQKVEATIVRISKEWIFLDVGGKSEGSLARKELSDQDDNLTVREGDKVTVYFLSVQKGEQLFTTKLGGNAALAHLEEAYHNRIPVTGSVIKELKGGYEVKIAGVARAFCPFSQMGLRRVEDTEQFIGQELSFKISEYKENGRNIIVSHRAILEEEREEKKKELRKTLAVGQTVKGVITSLRDFGAFIDIGGIEGLIPVSEIGWGRVEDIRGVLAEGQEVEAAVMKLDWANDRFSFSLRETMADPWDGAVTKYYEGSTHTGRVARLTDFGAFVTLEPGIDGLVHISKLGAGRKVNHPREVVAQGQSLEVKVEGLDLEKRRISLAVLTEEKEEPLPEKGGKKKEPRQSDDREALRQFQQQEQGNKSMGTLGDLLKAKMQK
ncbi:MAG: 30S ribosomal protein S1 [Desulfobulbaceae bacterium]|nr:30S ribosomal protein S1 [Desulfobulbaceae bacterium]